MEIDIEKMMLAYRRRAIENKTAKQPKSRRAELITLFIDRLNSDRRSSGRKNLSAGFYVMKMVQSGIKSQMDLEWFYGYCNDAKNFSSCWWWSLRVDNTKK